MKPLSMEVFEPLVGQVFSFELEDGTRIDLELREVTPGTARIREQYRPDERAPFSLVFRGGPEEPLPQQTYPLQHAELGRVDIFLVPIGPGKEGMGYEAVFA